MLSAFDSLAIHAGAHKITQNEKKVRGLSTRVIIRRESLMVGEKGFWAHQEIHPPVNAFQSLQEHDVVDGSLI
jgi:hypothetical protein